MRRQPDLMKQPWARRLLVDGLWVWRKNLFKGAKGPFNRTREQRRRLRQRGQDLPSGDSEPKMVPKGEEVGP